MYCNANKQNFISQSSNLFYLINQQIFIEYLLGIRKWEKCYRAKLIFIPWFHFPISVALFLLQGPHSHFWSYIQSIRLILNSYFFSTTHVRAIIPVLLLEIRQFLPQTGVIVLASLLVGSVLLDQRYFSL